MSVLNDWYPGDSVALIAFIAATAVAVVSTLGLTVSLFLKHAPAVRHSVLLATLACILAIPALMLAFTKSGVTLIALPFAFK